MTAAVLAATHALAGWVDEAGRAMQRLRQLGPDLRIATLGEWLPIRRSQDLAVLTKGLRIAGLPAA